MTEATADAMLNHKASATRGGVLGVYQRATDWPGQVAAMKAWGAAPATALDPKAKRASDAVVPIRRGKRAAWCRRRLPHPCRMFNNAFSTG